MNEGKEAGRRTLGKGNRHYLSDFKCLLGTIQGHIALSVIDAKGKIKCTPLPFMGIKYMLNEALSIQAKTGFHHIGQAGL